MNKMEGISEPAEVDEGPIESVLAVGAMIHSYDNVTASLSFSPASLSRAPRYEEAALLSNCKLLRPPSLSPTPSPYDSQNRIKDNFNDVGF